jgi:hypothetical protein
MRNPSHSTTFDPLSVSDLVGDFSRRVLALVDQASSERGQAIIDSIFSRVPGSPDAKLDIIAKQKANQQRRQLAAQLSQSLLDAIEGLIVAQSQELLDQKHTGSGHRFPRPPVAEKHLLFPRNPQHAQVVPPPRKRARKPAKIFVPPPLDPEQIKRDAENARLRALLRPTVDLPPTPPVPVPAEPVPQEKPQRPSTPGEFLRALEKEIQDVVPSLGKLGPELCTAQIAAWSGMVRYERERLPPDVFATMRPAFRIFLEHLTKLSLAMEAHVIDALESNWTPPSWIIYIEVNRAKVEGRAPNIPVDDLRIHYRAMLRALVRPHRRNVPEHALPIIAAAAEVLPAGDSQLRSAVRRHREAWKGTIPPSLAPYLDSPGGDTQTDLEAMPDENGKNGKPGIEPEGDEKAPEAEYESAWNK